MPPLNSSKAATSKSVPEKNPQPKSAPSPARPASPKPRDRDGQEIRKEVYPTIQVNGVDIPIVLLTEVMAKKLLGWETEGDYSRRKGIKVDFGDDFFCKDENGNKVRCWHNQDNRPFDEQHARKLAQDILTRQWADSRNGDDMTINGETIIVTKTAKVDSGQHRLAAVIFACQEWRKNQLKWADKWPTEPSIEAVIFTGVSDNSRVTRTLDNVRPRTLTDVLYTTEIYSTLKPAERRECSRILAEAINLMWKRTKQATEDQKYQTHSTSIEFLTDRHPKMLECVEHIFKEDKERSLSALKVHTGHCAGLLYLMGCCASDPVAYHVADPPHEKLLDWKYWETAKTFWTDLADTKSDTLEPVREAIKGLVDEDGNSGRATEKQAVICKAWTHSVEGDDVLVDDPPLEYTDRDDGTRVLNEWPTVGGIDLGPKPSTADVPTPQEIAEKTEEVRGKRVGELDAKAKGGKGKAMETAKPTAAPRHGEAYLKKMSEINAVKEKHQGRILLFKQPDNSYIAWMGDATAIALVTKSKKTERHESGLYHVKVSMGELKEIVSKLVADKRIVCSVEEKDNKTVVTELGSPGKGATAPAAKKVTSGLRGGTN